MSYKDDLKIDQNALDHEWLNHPIKFANWAEKEVEAQFEKDKAKEKLELVKSLIDSDIRSNPAKYRLDKITETVVYGVVIQSDEYKAANEEFLQATRRARILSVGREAFDHRKKALEKLTDLYLSNYWAEPRSGPPNQLKEASVQEVIHETLNAPVIRRRLRRSE
jgi:hypothetical protein